MKHLSYLFFANYLSSVVIIISALFFLIFMAIKIRSLSSGAKSLIVVFSPYVMFVSFVLIVLAFSLKYFSEYRIESVSINYLLDDNVVVKVDGNVVDKKFVNYFGYAIENVMKFKDSGSGPTKRFDVEISIYGNPSINYSLRQDSRSFNLYWLSAHSSNYTIFMGYVTLEKEALASMKTPDRHRKKEQIN